MTKQELKRMRNLYEFRVMSLSERAGITQDVAWGMFLMFVALNKDYIGDMHNREDDILEAYQGMFLEMWRSS